MHWEHRSSGGTSSLPHAALPHASAAAPAADVAAPAAVFFLGIAARLLSAAVGDAPCAMITRHQLALKFEASQRGGMAIVDVTHTFGR